MSKADKKLIAKYNKIKNSLLRHNYNYHVLDKPEISDYDYDQLYEELVRIEQECPGLIATDSPSQRVGDEPLDEFEKIKHRKPMLSLQNSYSINDILAFNDRILKFLQTDKPPEYFCEPKFDGLAIELVYEKGLLVSALTRGDGTTGENVLSNVKTIRSVPLKLNSASPPELLEVRGEILMLKNDFVKLNDYQQEEGLATFANPRNAAAGTIRQLDSRISSTRPLKIFCYGFGEVRGLKAKSQSQFIDQLGTLGFPCIHLTHPELVLVTNKADDLLTYYKKIDKIRQKLPFDIDGIVIKVNHLPLQEELGTIARSPRWANAAKFKPEQANTVVEKIIVQVGRTGALTPVAIMKPTKVGGVTITHATLHNQDEIDRKDVRVGDHVIIHRAGDVIPEVVSVLKEKRKKSTKKFRIPNECPTCKSKTVRIEGEAVTRCPNPVCPAITQESLKHFVSRRAMNIDKLGQKIVEKLYSEKLVNNFSDLYKLKVSDLMQLERQGEKSSQNIINSIDSSRHPDFDRFIYALGIRFVGEQTARALANSFGNLESFLSAKETQLVAIDDVGPKVAQSVLSALNNKAFIKEVRKLISSGVVINEKSQQKPKGNSLENMNIVVTGTLPKGRDEIKDLISSFGGKSATSVSKKTNYVLAGESAGSKLIKAQELGVPVINWDEFQELIKGDQ